MTNQTRGDINSEIRWRIKQLRNLRSQFCLENWDAAVEHSVWNKLFVVVWKQGGERKKVQIWMQSKEVKQCFLNQRSTTVVCSCWDILKHLVCCCFRFVLTVLAERAANTRINIPKERGTHNNSARLEVIHKQHSSTGGGSYWNTFCLWDTQSFYFHKFIIRKAQLSSAALNNIFKSTKNKMTV